MPLLALLRSTPLTEEQIAEVVREITKDGSPAIADGVINRDEIAEFISGMTHYDAGPENIIRVAARLARRRLAAGRHRRQRGDPR